MYIIMMIAVLFFAIIGLSTFILSIGRLTLHSGEQPLLLIIPEVDESNAEMLLRRAADVCSRTKALQLVCICDEQNAAYPICLIYQRRYPFLEIMSRDDAKTLLS